MYSCCGELSSAHQMFDEIAIPDLPTWNSIINANVQVGSLDVARKLFDGMHERNVTSWSCMIHGYVRQGEYKEALTLFGEMLVFEKDGLEPNGFTMSSVLSACSGLGALEQGKWAHACINRYGIEVTVVLGTALIDMYAKCGSIETASWVFENLGANKDVMAWSAMISGLAMHGDGKECIKLFYKMMDDGIRPNDVTLLGVLSGCVHCGFVNEGKKLFKSMNNEFGFHPSIQHYGCMVDLYSRAGLINYAMEIIRSMPMKPDVLIWGALLSGARKSQDIKTCEMALMKLIELDPTNAGAYVLLSNVYAKMGMWKDVRRVRDLMDLKGIKKVPGCSTVELGGIFHEFYSGDDSHPETREIYAKIEEVMNKLKMEGFVGSMEETLLDLDEEARETSLSHHSERLAVAFALLKSSPGSTIRVIKNLRICVDCHEAMKMISRVFDREIIIRDCSRFHYFRSGTCSCKDYW